MFNIPALQDVCVPCIIDGEWRWKGVESGDNWPQFPHWPVVPVVPGPWWKWCWMLDCWWCLPPGIYPQLATTSQCAPCQPVNTRQRNYASSLNFDIDTHQYLLYSEFWEYLHFCWSDRPFGKDSQTTISNLGGKTMSKRLLKIVLSDI